MSNYIDYIYSDLKKQVIEKLHDRATAITTDMWTSPSHEGYMTVTCHYFESYVGSEYNSSDYENP